MIHHVRASHNHGTDKEMFLLRNYYGQLTINSGENLRSEMIKVTGGTSTAFPTVRIKNAKFKVGTDLSTIREYFTDASRGMACRRGAFREFDIRGRPKNEPQGASPRLATGATDEPDSSALRLIICRAG